MKKRWKSSRIDGCQNCFSRLLFFLIYGYTGTKLIVGVMKKNLKLIVRRIFKRRAIVLDSIKSWTCDSADYRTSRFRCCCNAADPSEIRRRWRRNCRERRSDLDWRLPIRRCPCISRGRRIPSRCRAADSSSRSTRRNFCKTHETRL